MCLSHGFNNRILLNFGFGFFVIILLYSLQSKTDLSILSCSLTILRFNFLNLRIYDTAIGLFSKFGRNIILVVVYEYILELVRDELQGVKHLHQLPVVALVIAQRHHVPEVGEVLHVLDRLSAVLGHHAGEYGSHDGAQLVELPVVQHGGTLYFGFSS